MKKMSTPRKQYEKQYYQQNRQRLLEYQKQYRKDHKEQCRETIRRWSRAHVDRVRKQKRARQRVFRQNHPNYYRRYLPRLKEKYRIDKEYRQKELARGNAHSIPLGNKCERCGSTANLERHHDDYSYPLNFTTLCISCHAELRRSIG
jgi:hypothetical protein